MTEPATQELNVARDEFEAQWARCLPWMQATHDYWPNAMSMRQVKEAVLQGEMQFWHGPESAAITQVNATNKGRELYIVLVGGKASDLEEMFVAVEAWAETAHCNFITMFGRTGWLRLFPAKVGFKQTGIIMQKDL